MTAVIQRVTRASVSIGGTERASISNGFLILLGVGENDTGDDLDVLVKKIGVLRVFEDENEKMNLSCADVGGSALVISNFTLCADCRRGTRPDFFHAMRPDEANRLYEMFIERLKEYFPVRHGEFGTDMQVSLLNDGPVTIVLNSEDLKKPRNK